MPTYTLTYFDFSGSRGEECRLALAVAGVAFTDERLTREQWDARRAAAPYGQLPMLTVAGKGTLGQTNAILAYVGRTHGLHPSDPWEAARHEAVMGAVEDLRTKLDPTVHTKDLAFRKLEREKLVRDFLPRWGAALEAQIDGPFLAGAKIHVADLKVYMVTRSLARGIVDHIPGDVFAPFRKLTRLTGAVAEHPAVARWVAGHTR